MTESSFRKLLLRLTCIPLLSLLGFLAILGIELREIAISRLTGAQATTILLQTGNLEKSMIDQGDWRSRLSGCEERFVSSAIQRSLGPL